MSQNLLIDNYPVTARTLLSDPPPELVKEVARSPSHKTVKDAAIKLAQIKRARDLEEAKKLIIENRNTEFKAVNGLGEHKARIPMSMYFEMRRRCGDDYFEHAENIEEFLRSNPQFRIKLARGTRGQRYEGKG